MIPKSHRKQLLTFAHRGEARAFLKHLKLSPVKDVENLYEGDSHYLLITGEGSVETLMRLSAACALLKPELIVNYGTCGALRDRINIGNIYPVKTAYAAEGVRPLFKSFTTNIEDANVDCISAGERVQDNDTATQLGHFAHVVDREAWSNGAVAHQFKIPFSSYKMVTDLADGCLPISDRDQVSEALWIHFSNSSFAPSLVRQGIQNEIPLPDGFYFTTAQRRRFKSLFRSFQLRTDDHSETIANFIAELDLPNSLSPKIKASRLLDALADYLSPFDAMLRKKLDEQTTALRNAGWTIQFDPEMESEEISLKTSFSSENKLEELTEALRKLPYEKIAGLLRGHVSKEKDSRNV